MDGFDLQDRLFGGNFEWYETTRMYPRSYICGYCNDNVASNVGKPLVGAELGIARESIPYIGIYMCPSCSGPTFFDLNNKQYPGVLFGDLIPNLPPEIEDLYQEIRKSYSVGAYTGSILLSRKMLMNISIKLSENQQGVTVNDGESFQYYVQFLISNGYAPATSSTWIDFIRLEGNAATHRSSSRSEEDAKRVLLFIEMLLKINYEYTSLALPPTPPTAP